MSKYHPLDVRHPDNRDRERNSYLLAPADSSTYALHAVEAPAQVKSRRSADYRRSESTSLDTPTAASAQTTAAAPWGGNARPTPSPAAPLVTQTRRGGWLTKFLFFGFIAFAVLRSFGLWEDFTRFVSRTAADLGLF